MEIHVDPKTKSSSGALNYAGSQRLGNAGSQRQSPEIPDAGLLPPALLRVSKWPAFS
jgi:hypothetical protein